MRQPFSLILTFFFLLVSFTYLCAQSPEVEWQKCYGSQDGDYANKVQPTKDGGYILVGSTEYNGGDVEGYRGNPYVNDYWIVKVDAVGNVEWKKTLGGTYVDLGSDILQTPDGGYMVAGSANSIDCDVPGNIGGLDFWIIKLDGKGDIKWQKHFGGTLNEYAYSIDITTDGGFVIAGLSESTSIEIGSNHGKRDFLVTKITSEGELVWQKSYGGSDEEEARSIKATTDGGSIVTGFTYSSDGDVSGNHGGPDYWVIKLDKLGKLEWQKCLGGIAGDMAESITIAKDGGYVVAGMSGSNNNDVSGNHHAVAAYSDFWLVKLTKAGGIEWQKCYGGNANEWAYNVEPTSDGGYIAVGFAEAADGDLTCNAGIEDSWVIKIDGQGNLEWQKSMGGDYYDHFHGVKELSDKSYVLAGYTCSNNVSGHHRHGGGNGTCADFWLVKLAPPQPSVPGPSIKINTASAKICGGKATLVADVKFAGVIYTCRWFRNGINLNIEAPSYTASDFKENDQVICFLTTDGLCNGVTTTTVSDTVVMKLNTNVIQPTISIAASSNAICNDCEPISFKASITNAGPSPIYKWFINNVNTGFTGDLFVDKTTIEGDIIKCNFSDASACIINSPIVSNEIKLIKSSGLVPSVTIQSPSTNVCKGTNIFFNAAAQNGGVKPLYSWTVNGVNVGKDSSSFASASLNDGDVVKCGMQVDSTNKCITATSVISNTLIVSILEKKMPTALITTADTVVCKNANVNIFASTQNAGQNPSFQWKINGLPIGNNSPDVTINTVKNNDTITCDITVDPAMECVTTVLGFSNKLIIRVREEIAPSLTVSTLTPGICAGQPVAFTSAVENAGIGRPIYQWKWNSINVGNNLPEYSNSELKNGDSVYCLFTSGDGFCGGSAVASNVIKINVYELPQITVSPVDTFVSPGSTVKLQTTITGNIKNLRWEPAAIFDNALVSSPTTIPLNKDVIGVLTAVNDNDCSAVKIVSIKVIRQLFMPNAFTPNNDGINDVFRIPKSISLKIKTFHIYNRWGNKVFSSTDISKGWDGTKNGKEMQAGTYVYVLIGENANGPVSMKGDFLLIR